MFQVSEHFTEAGSSGAAAPGAASRSHTERRHGDVTWDLSHRCLSGREPFQVNKAPLNHSVTQSGSGDISTGSVQKACAVYSQNGEGKKKKKESLNCAYTKPKPALFFLNLIASYLEIVERKNRKWGHGNIYLRNLTRTMDRLVSLAANIEFYLCLHA